MQHQRIAGHHGRNLVEAFEVELGFALELVRAVTRADGDGQRVAAGALDEFHGLIGIGVDALFGGNVFFHAGELTEFGFHPHAAVVGVVHHLLRDGDVFLEGQVRAVDHDGAEAAVDAGLAQFKVGAVIEMHHHREIGLGKGGFHQFHDVHLTGILAGAGGNLKDQRRALFRAGLHDALNDFHVVDVESADGIPFLVGAGKHLFGSGDRHGFPPGSVSILERREQ